MTTAGGEGAGEGRISNLLLVLATAGSVPGKLCACELLVGESGRSVGR